MADIADNVRIIAGTTTDPLFASDDIGGVQYQRIKIGQGADGVYTDISSASPLPVNATEPVSTANLTNVTSVTTSATLAALNTGRRGLYIFNDSTALLYLKFGTAASSTSFTVKLTAGALWEMPNRPTYTGIVTGIWAAVNGAARITELV